MIAHQAPYPSRIAALLGLALAIGACAPQAAPDSPRAGWSPLVAVPDTVLLDTAGVTWTSSHARVWLRTQRPEPLPPSQAAASRVAVVETRHDVSCERREVRDLQIRAVGHAGEAVRDSVVQAPAWMPVAAHPALRGLLPELCARLAQLHPRGLHNLLGSDRP